MRSFILVAAISLLCLGEGAKLPSTFKICKRSDADLNGCFKEAVQVALPLLKDGIPDLGIAPAEPLKVETMSIDAGSGSVNVKQNYKNMNIYGITEAKVDDTKVTIEDKHFKGEVTITIPKCRAEADYNFDGRVLMLPITGDGKCSVEWEDAKVVINMEGGTFEKKGKTYVKVDDLKVHVDPKTASFHFDNLFNGDEALGAQMNNMINANWKELFGEVKEGYEDMLAEVVKNVANAVFTKVPYDELLPA